MTATPTPDEIAQARATMAAIGADVNIPHRSTQQRRAQRDHNNIAVISRRARSYRQEDGRVYGEVTPDEQRQSDAGAWRANQAIRNDCLPLVIAVDGTVERIYEVNDWSPVGKKWEADLGAELSNQALDRDYPDFPYRLGDDCPTRRGGAYRPEVY